MKRCAQPNFRVYGPPPLRVVLVHGGPGAAGELAPVAKILSNHWGVLEPLQTALTLEGQIRELGETIERHNRRPVILVGYSWGAWLSFIVCARHPHLTEKLILISSGPFEEPYAKNVMATRLSRLNAAEREEVQATIRVLESGEGPIQAGAFRRLDSLMSRADTLFPLPGNSDSIDFSPDIFQRVWRQAASLRQSGQLLDKAQNIRCPVTAIHGDYDPHPAQGVRKPLARRLVNFRFHLLKDCGHKPWIEARAREAFYSILKAEIMETFQ